MRLPSSGAISLSVALAASLYLGLTLWAGWREVWSAAAKAGLGIIGLILLLSLVNYGLRFIRWHAYLRLLGHPVPWRDDLRIYLAGFALTTTPGKAGEMARSFWLRSYGVPARTSVAAFIAERLQDLLAILLLCCVGGAIYPAGIPLIAGGLFAMAGVLLVLSNPGWLQRLHARTADRPNRLSRVVASIVGMILEFRRCYAPAPLVGGLVIGLVAWGAEAVAFGLLLAALGTDVPMTTAIFVYAFAMLAGAVSFLPGGLGGAEAAMLALLGLAGVADATAVAATVLTRLATLWLAVGLGAAAVATLQGSGSQGSPT